MSCMNFYPIFLNSLPTKKTILIGGNHEAERKVRELLECNAAITLISQSITDHLKNLADDNAIIWIARPYRKGDIDEAFIAIVADAGTEEKKRIFEDAEETGVPINVMDDPAHCTFTFGSIVRSGPLTIGISTGGAAPALAVRLRQRFEREFSNEYARFLEFLRSLREPMARHYPDFKKRRTLWYELIDSELLTLFRFRDLEKAYELTARITSFSVLNEALESKSDENLTPNL